MTLPQLTASTPATSTKPPPQPAPASKSPASPRCPSRNRLHRRHLIPAIANQPSWQELTLEQPKHFWRESEGHNRLSVGVWGRVPPRLGFSRSQTRTTN